MNGITVTFDCKNKFRAPSWGLVDLFKWKVLSKQLGGGVHYIQDFKNAWVRFNKQNIRAAAQKQRLPAELIAGVCWIEVAGDPNFIDRVAFIARLIDWSGPSIVDKTLTQTSPPEKTSFGSVSMQLRTAAHTLGLKPADLSLLQLNQLASCLEYDAFNIDIVARHLRQLANQDGFTGEINRDQVRIIGARYNRGSALTLDAIRKNTSYGDFIVSNWNHYSQLLW